MRLLLPRVAKQRQSSVGPVTAISSLGLLCHSMIETAPGIVQLNADISELKSSQRFKARCDDCDSIRKQNNCLRFWRTPHHQLRAQWTAGVTMCGTCGACFNKGKKVKAVLQLFPEKDYEHLLEHFRERLALHPLRSADTFRRCCCHAYWHSVP